MQKNMLNTSGDIDVVYTQPSSECTWSLRRSVQDWYLLTLVNASFLQTTSFHLKPDLSVNAVNVDYIYFLFHDQPS